MSAASITWTSGDPKAENGLIVENAPFALALCDRRGNIIAVNSLLECMFDVRLETDRSFSLADLIHPNDHSGSQQLFREVLNGKRAEFQIDSTDRAGQPLRWSVWRVQRTESATRYLLAVAEKISGTSTAERRLRQADRLETIGRLAGGVAHDFNNLLTGVLLYCDLLLATIAPGHPERRYAEEIRKAGLQATGLVRQLLALTRPPNFQSRPLSLNDITESMRNLLVSLIGENIELKFCLDPNLGLVQMDPTQAQQILLNLVLNARDAVPRGGRITVETRNCKLEILTEDGLISGRSACVPCAFFSVADNGKGMDAATRAHIFEPFFTTKAGKGTGLGLATVHDIVTGSGGRIHVESEPDQGTRISVLLPLAPQAVRESPDTTTSYPARRGEAPLSIKEE